jgi:hypothetical protein
MLMHTRAVLASKRLFFGALALIAVIAQAVKLHTVGALDPVNYLSYFTNLSNIFAGVVFLASGLYLLKGRKASSSDDIIRGAATVYMTITGIVYVTLLTGEDLGLLMIWVNIVTHIVMPIVVLADWLYQPPLTRFTIKQALCWLVFPAVYLAYSLVRGHATGWYPYPFLNPAKVGGYEGVIMYSGIILAAFVGVGTVLRVAARRLKRHV